MGEEGKIPNKVNHLGVFHSILRNKTLNPSGEGRNLNSQDINISILNLLDLIRRRPNIMSSTNGHFLTPPTYPAEQTCACLVIRMHATNIYYVRNAKKIFWVFLIVNI